jgi:hypothetical protein
MTMTRWILALALLLLAGAGCAAAFTSIRKAEDGSYYLTEHKAGGFHQQGRVYKCSPSGDAMNCVEMEIDW